MPCIEYFSVWMFTTTGTQAVCQNVPAFLAAEIAVNCCSNTAAQVGLIRRVIITDRGDCICFEWVFDKGVTYPL